jgi:putative transposase
VSPGTGESYPVTMISEVWRVPRSTIYAARGRAHRTILPEPRKRGPKTAMSDEDLVVEIREVLRTSEFLGEGHRKVRARLRSKGIRVGKNRVLRLMRENGLLAPVRRGKHARGDRSHSGRITTDAPDELWGTDATRFHTKEDGWCWFFVAVDHCVTEVVGWHVAKKGDRWAALEPVRQGVRTHMAAYAPRIALGLGLRHDWGPQYTAHQFQAELKWLGIRSTASYVGEPECNGVAERFIRTLKEECLYLHDFQSLEEARATIGAFIERYNHGWLLERHGYRTPAEARQWLTRKAA